MVDCEWARRYEEGGFEAARELTAKIERSLRSLTVNAPDWATLKEISFARDLYIPIGRRLTVTRRFAEGYKAAMRSASGREQLDKLRRDLENFELRLTLQGLTHEDLVRYERGQASTSPRSPTVLSLFSILQKLFHYAVLWPVAVIGAAINTPIAVFAYAAGKLGARGELVEEATYRLIMALGAMLFVYGCIPLLVLMTVGWQAAVATTVFLPIAGFTAAQHIPFASFRKWVRDRLTIVPQDVLEERRRLHHELLKVVDAYFDPSVVGGDRMFYKDRSESSTDSK